MIKTVATRNPKAKVGLPPWRCCWRIRWGNGARVEAKATGLWRSSLTVMVLNKRWRAFARAVAAVLHGSRQRAQCPQPRLGSGDADVVRASQLQHAVQDLDR